VTNESMKKPDFRKQAAGKRVELKTASARGDVGPSGLLAPRRDCRAPSDGSVAFCQPRFGGRWSAGRCRARWLSQVRGDVGPVGCQR